MADLSHGRSHDLRTQQSVGVDSDVGLKTLLSRLSHDASQLVHDEIELAKLELRDVADTLSGDVREAGQTLAKDLARLGVALSFALMGGLALTAGAVLGIGELLDAYWAGGVIVGIILLIAAAVAARSANADAKESDALRLESTRRTVSRDRDVLADELRETKDFTQHEAREFREHATRRGATTH